MVTQTGTHKKSNISDSGCAIRTAFINGTILMAESFVCNDLELWYFYCCCNAGLKTLKQHT